MNLQSYIIHYTVLTDRRVYMEGVERGVGLKCQWITGWDREEILTGHEGGEFGDPKELTAGSVSLILKHLEVYRRVVAEPEGWHLILEDDVVLVENFQKRLEECLAQLPSEWDLFFIGLGCDLHVPWWKRRRGKRVYYRGWRRGWLWGRGGCSRCTEAYLIHPDFARRLLESQFGKPPFNRPIDWHLNAAGKVLKARSFWAEPPLVKQGAFESWRKDPILNPGGRD